MNVDIFKQFKQFIASGILRWADESDLVSQTGLQALALEKHALSQGIVPLRYHRNIGTISTAEQKILLSAKVAVIGCGGLGGNALEQLARLGIGNIIAWDFDSFEEHNINRQILSAINLIGTSKLDAAAERLKAVNPAIEFQGVASAFEPEGARALLTGCNTVIDALDNVPDRLKLSALCRELQVPLVHGAVEGWIGQLTTQFPGESVIEKIYGQGQDCGSKGPVSTPGFTPALVASIQVAEVVKILLGRGELLRNRIMLVNLLDMDMDTIEVVDEETIAIKKKPPSD